MKAHLLFLNPDRTIKELKVSILATMLILLSSLAFAQTTVVDIIVNSEDHTTLETAVLAAELADDLSGDGPFTVFAPTDAAFAALPDGTLDALLQDPTGALAQILLYHVVGAKALSTDLSDGQMITTLNGDSITVSFMDGNVYIDSAMVTVADLEADNGVVHVIDAVILPSSTVVDIIVGSPNHNTLEAALIAADLVEALSGDGPFTVFAPTDDAFAALPEGTLEALLADREKLTAVLSYHVVPERLTAADLVQQREFTTVQGQKLTLDKLSVASADIEASNGIIHVIDTVLIPAQ